MPPCHAHGSFSAGSCSGSNPQIKIQTIQAMKILTKFFRTVRKYYQRLLYTGTLRRPKPYTVQQLEAALKLLKPKSKS
jgi:hypothetical protein